MKGKDGTLLCLMAYGDEEPYNELVRCDADGRELLRENITKSLNFSVAAGVSDIAEDADSMVSTGDGDFLGIAYDHTQNRSVLEVYSKADPAAVAGRQTITYAAYGVSDATKRAAMEFNQNGKP